jgi:DNA-binding IclR family transcriptional regulator
VAVTERPASSDASNGGVQVIARVGQLLRELDGEPWGLTLTQLASRLDLPRSTVHRLVGALVAEGLLISASAAGRVRIGPEFIRIASNSGLELRQQVEPLMKHISDATGETVDCSVLEGDQVRVTYLIPTQHQLRAIADVGASFPLHCSSKGKAMLAEMDDEAVTALLPKTLEKFTNRTLTTRAKLLAELAQIRQTGVAFDEDEHVPGICAAAIAAHDPFGSLFAISVPVPTQRFGDAKGAITDVLLETRRELRAILGPL